MKTIFYIIFLVLATNLLAQDLPTPPIPGAAFPLKTKFKIKLIAIDSMHFNYSIIEFEKFDSIVDTYNHKDLFDSQGRDSTITFYFCAGTHGESEEEKNKNMKILLLMKNYSKIPLKYFSEIQRKEEGEYEQTSNVGIFPGAIGMEMWPYMIYMIGLKDFEKFK